MTASILSGASGIGPAASSGTRSGKVRSIDRPVAPAAASASSATRIASTTAATPSVPTISQPAWHISRSGRSIVPRTFSTCPA